MMLLDVFRQSIRSIVYRRLVNCEPNSWLRRGLHDIYVFSRTWFGMVGRASEQLRVSVIGVSRVAKLLRGFPGDHNDYVGVGGGR